MCYWASQVFATLRSTWKSRSIISTKTKVRLFKSNLLSTFLYGAELWKMTRPISHKLEVFQNRCQCWILGFFSLSTVWKDRAAQEDRHEACYPKKSRRRDGDGLAMFHECHLHPYPDLPSDGPPSGCSKRGRPKEIWRRTVEKEVKEQGWTWGYLESYAADRLQWQALAEALCALPGKED